MKIRDLLKILQDDGWQVTRMRGSHRVMKNRIKSGIVVVAGHPNQDIAPGTLKSILKQAGLEEAQ